MLSPAYLQALPAPLVDLFSEVENDILAEIAKRVAKVVEFGDYSKWQSLKLFEMQSLNGDVVKKLSTALGKSEREVEKLLKDAGIKGVGYDDAIYKAAGLNPQSFVSSPALMGVLSAGIANTNGTMRNFTRSMPDMASREYIDSMDKAWLQVMSGAYSPQTAIARAVDDLASKGVKYIDYGSGRKDTAETAVRRAVLTGANQTTARLQLTRASELGWDLVQTTSHAGARPTHAVWQGGIYSISGRTKGYEELESATGYGTGEGLCGWNCYHNFYPFLAGVSTDTYSRDPARDFLGRDNDDMYAEQQQQRKLERDVRSAKREAMVLKSAVDTAKSNPTTDEELIKMLSEQYDNSALKLKAVRKDLDKYVKNTGLTESADRTKVGGFGHSEASSAVQGAKRAKNNSTESLTNENNTVIIKTGGKSGALDRNSKEANEHAELYYEEIRNRKAEPEIKKIAQNTGFTDNQIEKIRNHLFFDDIKFDDGRIERFSSDYDQSQAWQRLIEGKQTDDDILLLKHELRELEYMQSNGSSYEEAHNYANKKYNWSKTLKDRGN
jgi:hypothetical protein